VDQTPAAQLDAAALAQSASAATRIERKPVASQQVCEGLHLKLGWDENRPSPLRDLDLQLDVSGPQLTTSILRSRRQTLDTTSARELASVDAAQERKAIALLSMSRACLR
jgi:hypothetical protein